MAIPTDRAEKRDWYQEVTDQVLAEMEKAQRDNKSWSKSWSGLWALGLPLRNVGVPFSGINVWLLALTASAKGYVDTRWYTFNQAKEATGYKRDGKGWKWVGAGNDPYYGVKKGEHGTHVIRVSTVPVYVDSRGNRVYPPRKNEPQTKKDSWKARLASGDIRQTGAYSNVQSYVVFNAEQISGLPGVVTKTVNPDERYVGARSMIEALNINVQHLAGCDTAAYASLSDKIVMPLAEQFDTVENYWATLLHEVIHWTGNGSRLDRTLGMTGSVEYAFEELVAEVGSAFLCAHLGVVGNLRHPEYLASWIKRLHDDKRAIIRAATLAQKAVDFILSGGGQFDEEEDEESEETAAK